MNNQNNSYLHKQNKITRQAKKPGIYIYSIITSYLKLSNNVKTQYKPIRTAWNYNSKDKSVNLQLVVIISFFMLLYEDHRKPNASYHYLKVDEKGRFKYCRHADTFANDKRPAMMELCWIHMKNPTFWQFPLQIASEIEKLLIYRAIGSMAKSAIKLLKSIH